MTIPQQRAFNDPTVECCNRDAADCDCPPKKLRITTTVVVQREVSTERVWYKGMSPDQARNYELTQETEDVLREFVADVESTPVENLIITRVVSIIDGDS